MCSRKALLAAKDGDIWRRGSVEEWVARIIDELESFRVSAGMIVMAIRNQGIGVNDAVQCICTGRVSIE